MMGYTLRDSYTDNRQPTMHNEPNEKRIESQKSVRNGCSDQQKKNELFVYVEWIAYQF